MSMLIQTKGILEKEKERFECAINKLEEEKSTLPHGAIVVKKRGGIDYISLSQYDKATRKTFSKHIGKAELVLISLQEQRKKRKRLENEIDTMKNDLVIINKLIATVSKKLKCGSISEKLIEIRTNEPPIQEPPPQTPINKNLS
jgi:hypothetical protein